MEPTLKSARPARSGPPFAFQALRLIGSILLEAVTTFFHFVLFPFHRGAERDRIRRIILRLSTLAPFTALLGFLVSAGCQSPAPGSSFQKQLDETAASARDLIRMDDAQQSLEDDLIDLGSGTSPREMLWDIEQIISSPDAQSSLEDDLRDLGDWEPDALPETFELLGW